VQVPPLRDRLDDIPRLTRELLRHVAGAQVRFPNAAALEALSRRDYPGNVRELRNLLEVAAAFAGGRDIRPEDLLRSAATPASMLGTRPRTLPPLDARSDEPLAPYHRAKDGALADFERAYLERLMGESGTNISRAATRAGLMRHSLRALLKKHSMWRKEADD
jgi:DNA-binding NtrC family response regulator